MQVDEEDILRNGLHERLLSCCESCSMPSVHEHLCFLESAYHRNSVQTTTDSLISPVSLLFRWLCIQNNLSACAG